MRGHRSMLLSTLLAFGCLACEKCAPGLVGAGVGRLSVRNVGAIADIINSDTRCGFESPEVKAGFTTEGAVGSMGSATWVVRDCELDLRQQLWEDTDCAGVTTTVKGQAIVSAKRTISGTLTGNADQPVVPMSPDAVLLEITAAKLEGWRVEASSNPARMTNLGGVVSAKIRPRLATSASTGVCSIPTRNVEISDIAYERSVVRVEAEGRDFNVDIPSSSIRAVNGTVGDETNTIGGYITVWDSYVGLPGDGDGLDPDFDPEAFEEGYACTEDLRNPVAFECGDIGGAIAQGAARLTIRSLGAIADVLDKDTRCGFSSPAVQAATVLSGPVGGTGDATVTVTGCTIELPEGYVASTSCTGTETKVSGRVTVSGSKRISGRLTGDPDQPAVPMSDSPALIEITRAEVDNFTVEESGTALTMISGGIGGRITPRTAMDTALTACGFETPIARFNDVSYTPGTKVRLRAPQGSFDATLDGSNLMAVNGSWGPDTNVLRGTIAMNGESYSLPTNPSDDGLNPEYDQAKFDESWMCGTLDMTAPFECTFVKPLAQGAAQLGVLTLGTITELTEKDTTCGFSSDAVLDTVATTGTLGDPGGTAVFTIGTPCELRFSSKSVAKEDCNGKKTYVEGTVRVTGTKTLAGYVSGDRLQPIVPTTRDPATIQLQIAFDNFKVWTEPGDNGLEVRSGQLSGTVMPRTAIDTETGACSIPTPVAAIDGLRYQNADARITSQGKTFDVRVDNSAILAVNGSRNGTTNTILGSIEVDGTRVMIPTVPGQGLDPEYSQATFDASYACTPNMKLPLQESECNMMQPLGEGAARLLIQMLGAVTSISNEDNDCGYSSNLTNPTQVVGEPGQQGSMEWEIEGCELDFTGRDGTRPYQTDCLDRQAFFQGLATVTGMRHVEGLREEINILFLSFDSIKPNSPESVTVQQREIVFNEVNNYELDPGQTTPSRGITIHSGSMSATVNPITGENEGDRGVYDVPTKVARMSNVTVSNAPITIVYEGKTFNLRVDSASLSAFNGSYGRTGEKNQISGTITVNGTTINVPTAGLDPDFAQAEFDARYACTDDLVRTVTPAP